MRFCTTPVRHDEDERVRSLFCRLSFHPILPTHPSAARHRLLFVGFQMLFFWLAVILPPTLVFAYVAVSGLFLLLRSALQNPKSRFGPCLVVLVMISGYLLSFHEASRPIWKDFIGPFVSQILVQLGSIALGSSSSASSGFSSLVSSSLREGQNNWLGESTQVLLPIIEREAHTSHLVALSLGLFMSSYVTSMTNSLKARKIPKYM